MRPPQQEPDYPWQDTVPAPGERLELTPGVHWLRMVLPFALDHINLWLLRDDRVHAGWSVVDCGIADDRTRAAWERLFVNGLDGKPVRRVIVTHMHPDHVGLAHWLTQRWSRPASAGDDGFECRLWMSATDHAAARLGSRADTSMGGAAAAAFMGSHGLADEASLEKIRTRATFYAGMVPEVPSSYRRMMDGDVIAIGEHGWRCIAGYGHAPEHIALHCEALGVLISGDMLLPRISTNVSVDHQEPEANPLALFLTSIERLRALPPDTLVLPSHGKPFRGLQTRIDQLHAHHAERLDEVLQACARAPCSAADLLPVLFKRPLDLHQTTFAMGESVAHLNALWHEGRLVRHRDNAGVFRFAPG